MVQQEQVAPLERKPTWTEWAFKNVAGMYSDAGAAAARLRGAAGHGCRIVGGVSVMPLPLGHEVCVTVVPIEQTALYPINPHARALMRGEEAIAKLKKEDRDEMPRWGIGKSIINTLAMAVSVEWLKIQRMDNGSDPYYCEVQAWGRYKQVDGTYRPITATCDMDFRAGSAQLAGKSEAQIPQLRATIRRKAETGAKLRALREAFGIDHGINDDQIDRPFVISRVVFTGKTDDPALRQIFGLAIAQQHLAATGALFGQIAPSIPMVSSGISEAPQLTAGPGNVVTPFTPIDEDESDAAPPAAKPAAAPAPLPPEPAKPPPGPGDAARVYMPGKDSGPIAKAADKDLTYWEKKLRRDFDEGMDPRYAEKNTVQLLTIRKEMRRRRLAVDAHEGLDALDPSAPRPTPKDAGPRPPSDRGPTQDTRTADQKLADAAFGPDDDPNDYE